jgi:very-short-patch-repair endonuclease
MAGVLAAGPGALLSHQSAAVLWTLLRHDATTHVTSVRRSGSRPGLTVHRTTSLSGADRTRRDDIPVTALPRTLIDLADVLTPTQLAQAVERVPKIDVPTMRRALTRHPGRNGTAAFTKLLDAYDAPTRSPLETAFLKLCRHHQLPTPLVNTTIAGDERDFAWPDQRLVIETDGHAFHHTRAQRANDNRRDTDLGKHGWRPHRLTYEQVLLDPTGTATNVKALLDAPSYGAVATTISDITSRRSEFAS